MTMNRKDISATPAKMTASPFADPFAPSRQQFSMERHQPLRAQTVESEVAVPLLQALISGVLVMLVAASGLFVPLPWKVLALVFWLAILAGWLALVFDGRRLLWLSEKTLQLDLDGDGQKGEPDTFRLEIGERTPAGHRTSWLDVPEPKEKFATFARSAINGQSLSERSWTGRGNPYSGAEYNALRDRMLELGLLVWKNPEEPKQGLEVTAAGKRVLEIWLRQYNLYVES